MENLQPSGQSMALKKFFSKKGEPLFFSLFLFLTSFFSTTLNSQPTSQTFNSSGTYIVPAGYSAIVTIQAWGGGGGGSATHGGGGGGGGAYSSVTTTIPAGSYVVTVGNAGAIGNNGTASSFTTLVSAGGGLGATTSAAAAGGTVITGTGHNGGTGGPGTGGNPSGGGGGGSATVGANGGNGSAGTNGNGQPGGPGGNGHGNGGNGAVNSAATVAIAGIAPGGGGGGASNHATSTAAVGASGRVVVTVNSVLPVKLGNIKAFEKLNGIQIEWIAYSEQNLSKYQVERSADGGNFIVIGEVPARNQMTETKYSFFDPSPIASINFYRIKTIDIDLKAGFSNIVKLNLDKTAQGISLYPNPVHNGFVSFQGSDLAKGNYEIKIFNAGGQQVFNQALTHSGGALHQSIQLPVSTGKGIYIFSLNKENVKVMNRTFIVD